MMKDFRDNLMNLIGNLLDKRSLEDLSSEERLCRMEQIDEQIEILTDLIGDLIATYEDLEEQEKLYQETRESFKNKAINVRAILSRKNNKETKKMKEYTEDELLELSYEISDEMNMLRRKIRRTDCEERKLKSLIKRFEEVSEMINAFTD